MLQNKIFQGKKILLVDDDTALLSILRAVLKNLGLEVATATLPSVAMVKLREAANRKTPFDLVLMDFVMPEQDGIATAHEIRNDPLLTDTPIILLTAYGAGLDQQRTEAASINVFLTKPVIKEVLHENIQMVLEKAQERHDAAVKKDAVDLELFKDYTVLLVDDNAFNQILVKEILQDAGMRVETASNGKEALEALLDRDIIINVILMEVQIPGLKGLAASSLIRQCESGDSPETGEHQALLTKLSAKIIGTHTPIVAMSSSGRIGDRERCLQAGMDDYIATPFMQKDVLWVLLRAVNSVA